MLLAGLTRALVATALAETRRGTPVPAASARWVDAALTAAARHGLNGAGVNPFTGQTADARTLLSRLIDHVHPALGDRGDAQSIIRLLQRLDNQGTGADRQRALFAAARSAPHSPKRSPAPRCPATSQPASTRPCAIRTRKLRGHSPQG